MVRIELTEAEAALLEQSLRLLLSDVRMEMCDTDRSDFRDGLKREKAAIESVLAQIADRAA